MKRGFPKLGFFKGLREPANDGGKKKMKHEGGGSWSLLIILKDRSFLAVNEEDEQIGPKYLF